MRHDIRQVDGPFAHQHQAFFPNVPVVAEGPLQRRRFGDQLIQREADRSGAPADLVDLAAGTDYVKRKFQCRREASRIDHHVGAVSVAHRHDQRHRVLLRAVDRHCCAKFFGNLHASVITICSDHHDIRSAHDRCHLDAEQADRAGADHDHQIARFKRRVLDQRTVGHAERFGQRRLFQADIFRHLVQDAAGNFHIFGKRAVNLESIAFAFAADMIVVGATHHAFTAVVGMRLRGHPVAYLPTLYIGADFSDGSGEFVAEDQRHIHFVRNLVVVHVGIAAANPDIRCLNQYIIRADLRHRDFPYLCRAGHIVVLNNRFHHFSHYFIPLFFRCCFVSPVSSAYFSDTSSIVVAICSCIQCLAACSSRPLIASKIKR